MKKKMKENNDTKKVFPEAFPFIFNLHNSINFDEIILDKDNATNIKVYRINKVSKYSSDVLNSYGIIMGSNTIKKIEIAIDCKIVSYISFLITFNVLVPKTKEMIPINAVIIFKKSLIPSIKFLLFNLF